jgi:hypothetical protein
VTTRRALLAATGGLLVAAAAPAARAQDPRLPGSFEAWRRRFDAGDDAPDADRLLGQAEAQLAAGDAQAALDTLQRAANLAHTPQIECTITRAQVQAGAYRQALASGAHAALSHRAFPAAMALYAWLLHAGGQSVIAARLLDDAIVRAPDDAVLRLARERLAGPWPEPSGALLDAPLRCAPHAFGPQPASVRCAGTALLCGDGRAAIVPAAVVGAARRLWLRNGLGATVAAEPAATVAPGAGVDLLVLRLAEALPVPPTAAAARAPFAGSPLAAVEHVARESGDAAWPLLRQGFAGRLAASGPRPLGVNLPAGPRGGPVFDRAGHLAGIALRGPEGDRLVPVQALPHGHAPAAADGPAAPLDAVYESALLLTLQVLVARG